MKTGNPHPLKEGREETIALAPGMGRFPCNTERLQQFGLQAVPVPAADVFHLIYRHPFGGLERLCCWLHSLGLGCSGGQGQEGGPAPSLLQCAACTPHPLSAGITGFSQQ